MGFNGIRPGSFLTPYMAMATGGRFNVVYDPMINEWVKKIGETVQGKAPGRHPLELWVSFHPKKGEILEVSETRDSAQRRPEGTGVIRVFFHFENRAILVEPSRWVVKEGKAVVLTSQEQNLAFSRKVQNIVHQMQTFRRQVP